MSKRGWTPKRRQVLEAIQGRTDHPTAEEVYRTLREKGDPTSLATVYRALRALAAEEVVQEIHGLGADRFDPVPDPHYHLVCTRCNRIYDAELPYQRDLDAVQPGRGFTVSRHDITFFGICSSCSDGKEARDG